MKLWSLLISATLAVSQSVPRQCGQGDPTPELRELARAMQAAPVAVQAVDEAVDETLVIPTYLHVVESADRKGTVTTKMLDDQVWDGG